MKLEGLVYEDTGIYMLCELGLPEVHHIEVIQEVNGDFNTYHRG